MKLIDIALQHLHAHPENANRMSAALLDKLAEHIRSSGAYPPIIVRAHPKIADSYEILDGHHRVQALERLGIAAARCDVWDVDDQRARILLLTLNRLQGRDDPLKRGRLIEHLRETFDFEQLARMLPDEAQRMRALLASRQPPPPLQPVMSACDMPVAVTFFLSAAQRDQLLARLKTIAADRTAALLQALALV